MYCICLPLSINRPDTIFNKRIVLNITCSFSSPCVSLYYCNLLQIQLLAYLLIGNIMSSNMTPNNQLKTVRTLLYSHMSSCKVTNQSMHHSWNNVCSSEQGSTEFQEEKRKLHRICQDK